MNYLDICFLFLNIRGWWLSFEYWFLFLKRSPFLKKKSSIFWSIVNLQCCVSSGVQQSESVVRIHTYTHTDIYIYIHSFLHFFSHTENWIKFPVLYSRSLLVIYFIYSSVYMSIPISHFISPWLPPVSHKFVFYTCNSFCFVNKVICTLLKNFTCKWYHIYFSLSDLLH